LVNVATSARLAESVLFEQPFDFVTLDPFGSPAFYLDALFRQLPRDGVAVLSATDVATLYGAAPQAARRHYGGVSCRSVFFHRELGARLLAGAAATAAARREKGIEVLYALSTEHFLQLAVRVTRGRKVADACVAQVQPLLYCVECDERAFGMLPTCGHAPPSPYSFFMGSAAPESDAATLAVGRKRQSVDGAASSPKRTASSAAAAAADVRVLGPCWSGALYDRTFVTAMLAAVQAGVDAPGPTGVPFARRARVARLLEQLVAEADGAPLVYSIHALSKHHRSPPVLAAVETVRAHGYSASRSHLDDHALRSDAPVTVLRALMRECYDGIETAKQQQDTSS
jgi:tRNA (guanine26-N2/guanine27-N2)-dimethyltransferase